jgi:hypothetical protein
VAALALLRKVEPTLKVLAAGLGGCRVSRYFSKSTLGTGGVLVPPEVLERTLTISGLARIPVCGVATITAFFPYMVDATLERGAYDVRAYEVRSLYPDRAEYVESRKSPGTKKCCSSVLFGVLACEMAMGMGGTGGTRTPGDVGVALLVTPGM